MPNIENFIVYEHWQYDLVRHMFTLTVAVFVAGLVYFLTSSSQVAPRYRLSSSISAVVMASAALELLQLYLSWDSAFQFRVAPAAGDAAAAIVGGAWHPVEGEVFSNGYRYANWSIDVPMLLTQILVVLGIRGADFWKTWWKFVVAGLAMIWTGYVGQLYEPTVAGLVEGPSAPFWIWGGISTVFYVYLVYVVWTTYKRPVGPVPDAADRALNLSLWILLVSWTLYPIAYAIPAFWADGTGVTVRQGLYTVADITSKLVFGVVLGRAARLRSAYEGYEMALATQADAAPGRLPEDENRMRG